MWIDVSFYHPKEIDCDLRDRAYPLAKIRLAKFPFNIHMKPIVIMRQGRAWWGLNLYSLKLWLLMLWCKPQSQHQERKSPWSNIEAYRLEKLFMPTNEAHLVMIDEGCVCVWVPRLMCPPLFWRVCEDGSICYLSFGKFENSTREE